LDFLFHFSTDFCMAGTNPRSYDAVPSRKVAFIGLGVMGYPMAAHLALAGHQVAVYNRNTAKALAWCEEYAHTGTVRHALTPRLAAQGADIVFCCVGNDDDLRSVVLGADGAFAGMEPGGILVDHTTASAEVARELYAAGRTLGLHFVDAPVSGGQAGAQNGLLTVMCGGDAAPFATPYSRWRWRFHGHLPTWAHRALGSWPKWSIKFVLPDWCKAWPRR
jgi:3-hydroxyisobutyrate dehydrogenase